MFTGRLLYRFPSPRLSLYPSARIIRSAMASQQYSDRVLPPLPPREFQLTGFEVIEPSQMVEEERLPFYNRDHYYPMRIGEVLKNRYQELEVFKHLAGITVEHSGRAHVRQLEDLFKMKSCNSEHDFFVITPLGMSIRTLQELHKDGIFAQSVVKGALDQVEEDEIRSPSTRKQIGDTIIYVSRYMLGGAGPLVICDFGQAHIGNKQRGNAMPVPYRAPETWDFLKRRSLFRIYDKESEDLNNAHHLAAMTALLGPPPPEFLKRSKETCKYWDVDEERVTAGQAYYHRWLRGRSDEPTAIPSIES
ncbi:unnamed protein product [Sphagnum balticum]